MKLKHFFISLTVGFTILINHTAALSTESIKTMPSYTSQDLESGVWLLRSVGEFKHIKHTIDLSFKALRVSGSDGCNRFNGSYEASSAGSLQFKLNGMASTMMACIGEGDDISRIFRSVLTRTRSYAVLDGQLRLSDEQGNLLALYDSSSTSLLATRWKINSLNNGREAVYSDSNLDRLELTFLHHNQLIGRIGCVALLGHYVIDEAQNSLTFSKLNADSADCKTGHSVSKEHTELINALKKTRRYQRTGNALALRSADGALQLQATLKN
jgi:heat shock protein HslJ